jgi:predicted signal transduction protein with EAL and GGDEF domain
LAALSEPFSSLGEGARIGASIGVAICPQHGTELPVLMKAADTAMYYAKSSGRARVCLFDADLARQSEQRTAFAQAMSRAIAEDELALVYHPRLCLRSGAILAGDAALRWNRPGEAPVRVDDFLPAVEDAGLEQRLSARALSSALSAYGRWREAGLSQRLCIRLSPGQVERGDFAEALFAGLAGAPQPQGLLEIEVPSAALGLVRPHVRDQLETLRRLGVSVVVGGFGAAGMDLAALRAVPTDRIKLDPALVADIDRDARARTVLSALLHLVHGLACEAVAMGVEREEQVEVLRAAGCDAMQGFFAADPMEERAFVAWIAAQDCARSLARAS